MRLHRRTVRRKNTLLLLRSPLQAYLAYKIVQQEELPSPLVVYLSLASTAKEERYYSLIRSLSEDGIFIQLGSNHFFNALKEWRKIITVGYWFFRGGISLVLVANVWLWPFRVLARWSNAPIATMDDGSLNYSPESQLEWLEKRDQKNWLTRFFRGYSTKDLCEKAERHYALRPDWCHSFGPEPIAITLSSQPQHPQDSTIVNIFLGQPLEKVYSQVVVENYLRAYKKIGGIYFPHPCEEPRPFETVDSPMIIEEFIATEDRRIRVFGLFTTALITLQGVDKFYFDLDGDKERRKIMERAGCEIMEREDIDNRTF